MLNNIRKALKKISTTKLTTGVDSLPKQNNKKGNGLYSIQSDTTQSSTHFDADTIKDVTSLIENVFFNIKSELVCDNLFVDIPDLTKLDCLSFILGIYDQSGLLFSVYYTIWYIIKKGHDSSPDETKHVCIYLTDEANSHFKVLTNIPTKDYESLTLIDVDTVDPRLFSIIKRVDEKYDQYLKRAINLDLFPSTKLQYQEFNRYLKKIKANPTNPDLNKYIFNNVAFYSSRAESLFIRRP